MVTKESETLSKRPPIQPPFFRSIGREVDLTVLHKQISLTNPPLRSSATLSLQRTVGNRALAARVQAQRKPATTQRQVRTQPQNDLTTLQKGDQGPTVTRLQQKLNAAGVTPLRPLLVDGQFGPQTELHVKKFQRRHQLIVTGIVDASTWAALQQVETSVPKPEPSQQQSTAIEPPWLAIARAEIGTKEIVGKQHNPRVLEYLGATRGKWSSDETPWCSGFVNWVMAQAGYGNTGNARAISWLNWGKKVTQPELGAIAIISHGGGKGHVGFVVGKQGNNLLLLGGNQRNAVRISVYPVSKFSAFVFPSDYETPAAASGLTESRQNYGRPLDLAGTR
jgi:uncharacterized protein (TIGR02594 family)